MIQNFFRKRITKEVDRLFSGARLREMIENGEFDTLIDMAEKNAAGRSDIAKLKELKQYMQSHPDAQFEDMTFHVQGKDGQMTPISKETVRNVIIAVLVGTFTLIYFFFTL